jgi:predicted nucleic acid-binding protein
MAIDSCLVDTNILLRLTRRSDPQHSKVNASLAMLAESGTTLFYALQNIAELWNAMTRPIPRNGFGLTAVEAEREVLVIEAGMSLLPEREAVYREWRRIVVQNNVSGVQVHDARLAAIMSVHGVSHILTLNVADFSRFRGLTVVHPDNVQALLRP